MTIKVTVRGDVETIAKIQSLAKKIKVRMLRKAVNAGANPSLKRARKLAPKRNRYLVKSLEKKVRQYSEGASAVVGQVRGRGNQDKVVERVSKRKGHNRRSGGISGRGMVVPVHLVDQPVKRHVISPSKSARILYGKRAVMIWQVNRGRQNVYSRGKVIHPGHGGRHFMEVAALNTNKEAEATMTRKLAEDVDKAATQT